MITRRTFVVLVAAVPTATSQSRLDNAKAFVEETHLLAEAQGRYLANQDMLQITMKVLIKANNVAQIFRDYQILHSQTIAAMRNSLAKIIDQPELITGQKELLRSRYDALKGIIRDRYEASWIPTNLDQAQLSLSRAFEMAADDLAQIALTGRVLGKDTSDKVPSFFGPPQNTSPQKPECSFMALSPQVSTPDGKNEGYKPGDSGTFFFSCPGPEGQNDWIKAANIFGEGAAIAFSISATAPNPYSLIVGIGLAALSLVSGVIGMIVSGEAIHEETRLATEADIYKFTHVAVPEDIASAYRAQANRNVEFLRSAAKDVTIFIGPASSERAALLSKHATEKSEQDDFEKQLTRFEQVKCRLNRRGANPPLVTALQACPAEANEDPVADQHFYESFRKTATMERLWGFVRFKVLDMLNGRDSVLAVGDERLVWRQIDQNIERQFLRLMSSLDLVNEVSECEKRDSIGAFPDIGSQRRFQILLTRFHALVTMAIDVAFGDTAKPAYLREVSTFEVDLMRFSQAEGMGLARTANLLRAFMTLKQRTA